MLLEKEDIQHTLKNVGDYSSSIQILKTLVVVPSHLHSENKGTAFHT